MNHAEIEAWAVAAPDASARAVRFAVIEAHGHWLHRTADPAELHDLAPHALTGLVLASTASRAASAAAAEVAIVCEIWPRSIDAALGRAKPGLLGSR